ncbi:MAG: hypothetical protein FJ405_09780 [Verrucomicrobia bacterium]|nr:hypothetical protein [Verrucomicrobiota bacterium]
MLRFIEKSPPGPFDRIRRVLAWLILLSGMGAFSRAGTPEPEVFKETFDVHPVSRGWEKTGDQELINWNPALEHLDVTWDSSRANTFFRYPLGRSVTPADDFGVSLDLLLTDIAAGVQDEKPYTFQIAFGFHRKADADQPGFIRAAGSRAPNLVEFNFFPDTGFGPTVWPAMAASDGQMSFTGDGDYSLFDLPLDVWMRINLHFAASNRTAYLTVQTNGVLVGPLTDAPLASGLRDFELDAFSITSYSDSGQNPPWGGSILGHGSVDNIEILQPAPPIREERFEWRGGSWRFRLMGTIGWGYHVEASDDFLSWRAVSKVVEGAAGPLVLEPEVFPGSRYGFLRVRAVRL